VPVAAVVPFAVAAELVVVDGPVVVAAVVAAFAELVVAVVPFAVVAELVVAGAELAAVAGGLVVAVAGGLVPVAELAVFDAPAAEPGGLAAVVAGLVVAFVAPVAEPGGLAVVADAVPVELVLQRLVAEFC